MMVPVLPWRASKAWLMEVIIAFLPASASRGDQLLNARSFRQQGFSMVLEEESITSETLLSSILELYRDRDVYIQAMKQSGQSDAIAMIAGLIEEAAENKA